MKKRVNISSIFWFFLLFTISAFDYSAITLFHHSTIPLVFAQPQIRLTEIVWKFGELKEGVTAHHKITVKNIGSEELKVNARSSCDCLQVHPEKLTVSPQGTTDLKVSIYTQGYPGKFGKYIYLDTNDPENQYVTLLVKGEITRIHANKKHELARIKEKPSIDQATGSPRTKFGAGQDRHQASVVSVTLFSSFNCLFCRELRETILPSLEKRFNTKILVREYSLDEPKNYEILLSLEKKLGRTENKIPVLFIGEDVLGGEKNIRTGVEELVRKYIGRGGAREIEIIPIEKEILQKDVLAKYKQFRLLPVLIAGFIDGLNPCAFATIVFFIAYLTMILKKTKKEILLVSITFILGVFVTYLLIGLGLAKLLQLVKGLTFISAILYFLIGLFTLILAFYSFRDFYTVKKLERGDHLPIGHGLPKKEQGKVVLQLPIFLRWKIYDVIEKQTKLKYFIFFAFITGAIVSVLELFCTGQVYLPTIMYIIQTTGIRYQASGISYLFLYSLMFILPLVIIFILVYFGMSSEKIEFFGRKHIATVKFLTGLVFLFLSLSMFLILIKLI